VRGARVALTVREHLPANWGSRISAQEAGNESRRIPGGGARDPKR